MTAKLTIPTQTAATKNELNGWLSDQPYREFQREQLAFAAMAYLGMCRHSYLSADWTAHNALWAASCNALSRIIDPTAAGGADKLLTDRVRANYTARGWRCQG